MTIETKYKNTKKIHYALIRRTLEQFQTGSSSCAHVTHLVFRLKLDAYRGCISTPLSGDDDDDLIIIIIIIIIIKIKIIRIIRIRIVIKAMLNT